MLDLLPAGKRRWQRLEDSCEKGLRGRCREDEDDQLATDKTHLLNVQQSSTAFITLVDVDGTQKHKVPAHEGEAENSVLSWRCQKDIHATDGMKFENPNQSKRALMPNSTCPSLPIKKKCNHASWQGFKQILRKQFTPPFPFGKGLMPPEDLWHLREGRIEGATQRSTKVLGASTNLVELRKLNVKAQNGIHKSAFAASTDRGRSKENLPHLQNHNQGTSWSSKTLGSQENVSKNAIKNAKAPKFGSSKGEISVTKRHMKENGVFRKVKRQVKNNEALLLADSNEE